MHWLNSKFIELDDRVAISDMYGDHTYCELAQHITAYKTHVETRIKAGQVVGILSDYNFYSIALLLALLESKAIVVPIVSQKADEISNRLEVANCDWVLTLTGQELQYAACEKNEIDHDLVGRLKSDMFAGLILFSSGSTGVPKGMIHNFDHLVDSFKGKKTKNLNMLVFLMFDHIGGLNTLFNTLAMGAHIILPENRNPDYIGALIEKYEVNVLPSTPTFLNMMLMAKVHEKHNLKSLKMITYGTEAMPASVLVKLKSCFPRARLMQTFGTSETGIAKSSSRSSDSLEMKLDDPNLQYKVVSGELWLKSKTQVMGYLNADMSSFTTDGWFKTGDLVEVSNDGFIKIIGRSKEVINVGGEKVLPAEIESVVLELDIIEDCMAYSEKNAITGQMVAIQIVLAKDITEKDAKKMIRNHCRMKLDGYKVPAKFIFTSKTNFGDRFKKIRL